MTIATDDRLAILDLLARYCWALDDGEGEAWAQLWTEDGHFTGIPEPIQGRDGLRQMAEDAHQAYGGKLRHHINAIVITPGASQDDASVKAYSVVSNWAEGGQLFNFAKARWKLVRTQGTWLIKSLHAEMS